MKRREELVEQIVEAERAIQREIYSAAIPEWLLLELTMAQWKGLLVLFSAGPLPVGGFAEQLSISLPTASILADRLVQSGLVERYEDIEDRRRTIVRLTPDGEELITRLRHGGFEVWHSWLEQLDDAQVEALAKALEPLAAAATSIRGSRIAGVYSERSGAER